jgi:hypothetical protein
MNDDVTIIDDGDNVCAVFTTNQRAREIVRSARGEIRPERRSTARLGNRRYHAVPGLHRGRL